MCKSLIINTSVNRGGIYDRIGEMMKGRDNQKK